VVVAVGRSVGCVTLVQVVHECGDEGPGDLPVERLGLNDQARFDPARSRRGHPSFGGAGHVGAHGQPTATGMRVLWRAGSVTPTRSPTRWWGAAPVMVTCP
jgi:hypothetical protein